MARFTIPATRPPGLPPSDPNYNCYGAPTLTPDTNEKMWLRLRVFDDPEDEYNPHLYVVAGWNDVDQTSSCAVDGDIGNCPRVCRLEVIDPTITLGNVMSQVEGRLMYWVHDAGYRAWVIRSGSRP